jgi:hypothetical protein
MHDQDRLVRWRSPKNLVKRYRYRGICGVLGLLFACWEGYLRWPSKAAHISILTAIVVMFALALVAGRYRQPMSTAAWLSRIGAAIRQPSTRSPVAIVGALIWLMLVLAVAGWDLHSFLLEQHSLPTLSYLIGRVSRFALGRSVLVATWLALGGFFVLANRSHVGRKVPTSTQPPTGDTGRGEPGDQAS